MRLTLRGVAIQLDDFHLEADLSFPSGELITLLGPSGCGKTTLLKIIAGLYYPDRGSVRLGDREITRLDARYRNIGMVFQDYALFPHMNVMKNICYGMKEKGRSALRRGGELLEMVHLPGYDNRKPEELSGGEKQRVALARALAMTPDLLLLDEPLSALDAQLRRSLRRQIREIQQQTGLTAVYVTHDQEEAMAISDRIVLMNAGRISQTGPPEALYSLPENAFAGTFLGTANMIRILSAAPGREDRLELETEAGRISLPLREPKENRTAEDLSGKFLHFRPEDCRLGETESPAALSGRGRVLYKEYGGDFQYLEIRSGDAVVRLKTSAEKSFRERDTVPWFVRPEHCLILS